MPIFNDDAEKGVATSINQNLTPAEQARARSNINGALNNSILSGLGKTLDSGTGSAVLSIYGDSTGYSGWTYALGTYMATAYPGYNIRYVLRDDTTNVIPTLSQVRNTPASGPTKWTFISRGCSIPATVFGQPLGDIDIRCRIIGTSLTPSASQTLLLNQSAGAIGVRFYIASSGVLGFAFSLDSAVNISAFSTAAIGSVLGAVTDAWVRVTRISATGVTAFYVSANNGLAWTQVGANVATTSGDTQQTAANWFIGEYNSTTPTLEFSIAGVEVRTGVNGRIVNPICLESWAPAASGGATLSGAPTLYIVAFCKPSQTMAYWDTNYATNNVIGYPTYVIFADGHNWGGDFGVSAMTAWDSVLAKLRVTDPSVCVSVVTQNPSNAQYAIASKQRALRQIAWAGGKGISSLNVTQKFLSDAGWPSILLSGDNLHPTEDGYSFWASAVSEAILGNKN